MHKLTQRCLSTSENSFDVLARRCKDNSYNRWVQSEGLLINLGKDSCFIGVNNQVKIGFTRPMAQCRGDTFRIWRLDIFSPWDDNLNIRNLQTGQFVKVDIDGLVILINICF